MSGWWMAAGAAAVLIGVAVTVLLVGPGAALLAQRHTRGLADEKEWADVLNGTRDTLLKAAGGTVLLGRCCVVGRQPDADSVGGAPRPISDGRGELGEGGGDPELDRLVDGEFVVAAAEVLYEGVSRRDRSGAGVGLQAAHRPQPSFELAVVGLDPIVGVPVGAVPRGRHSFVEHPRVGRSLVGDHLGRPDLDRRD